MTLPVWIQAGFWGLVAGSALLIGAATGYFAQVPQRLIAAIMAFGGGVAALIGYAVFGRFSAEVIAGTTALAAGAILAMLADTMIPEAFEQAHDFAGLITVVGFLLAFVITKLSE